MTQTLEQLSRTFDIPGAASVVAGAGGLPCVRINSKLASGEIYLHGAHVTRWQPAGQQPVLFMSEKSMFQPGRPIRGGVPLCFPWFGPKQGEPTAAAHGFVRLMEWTLESLRQLPTGAVEVVLALETNEQTQSLWAADATLRHRVVFGQTLEMTLEVHNRGSAPAVFQEAQHTYFVVGDVRQVRVLGLEGVAYLDKVDGAKRKVQDGPITFTQETDRVYLGTQSTCVLEDPSLQRTIRVEKENSRTTVVWSPWINKAKAMADFGDDEWPGMVCIETCNVGDYAIRLDDGQTHRMSTRIAVASRP